MSPEGDWDQSKMYVGETLKRIDKSLIEIKESNNIQKDLFNAHLIEDTKNFGEVKSLLVKLTVWQTIVGSLLIIALKSYFKVL